MSVLAGSCFCGEVTFEVTTPTKWCGHCHCSMCQHIQGAAFVTWVGCESDQVKLIKQDQLKWYASSPGAERGSCAVCGTHLFFRSENWPGELHVTRTSLPEQIDREPSGSSFEDTRVAWLINHQ